MRLVCPNCSAQYEIDGSMIPEEGRDVQCSNCGHTWFELPGPGGAENADMTSDSLAEDPSDAEEFDPPSAYDPDDDDSFEDEADTVEAGRPTTLPENLSRAEFEDDDDTDPSDSLWDNASEPDESPEPEPEDDERTSAAIRAVTAAAETDDTDIGEDSAKPEIDQPSPAVPTQRRPADAAALDILREEAEREMSQRRIPASDTMETQPDLGLESIRGQRTPSRALKARMAHLGEEFPDDEDIAETAPKKPTPREPEEPYEEPRRDLLPDIDEINSTLKAAPAPKRDLDSVTRSGFRIGFLLMLFLTIAAIFAYAQAPAIARALPDAESTMISYVDWANGLRDWVDGLFGR